MGVLIGRPFQSFDVSDAASYTFRMRGTMQQTSPGCPVIDAGGAPGGSNATRIRPGP
jgi:hypothetical protein